MFFVLRPRMLLANSKKTKGLVAAKLLTLTVIGRCERIRTFDPLHPMQVRYQAAPHTEASNYSLIRYALLAWYCQ